MERLSNTLETIVAEQARSLPGVRLTAHMMGEHDGQPCTVLLRAGLLQLGPQIVPGENSDPADDHSPGFHIGVAPAGFQTYAEQFLASESPAEMLAFLEESDARENQQLPPWEACMMSERERQAAREAQAQTGCTAKICSPGQMVLEAADHDHIAGSFEFEVVRWHARPGEDTCHARLDRSTMSGHFSIRATDDGTGDDSLYKNLFPGNVLHLLDLSNQAPEGE